MYRQLLGQMKILIVDDNLVQRMVLEFNLKKNNYQVLLAANGQEALQSLEKQGDVDLVITDIKMPDMDGLELLRRMKSNPRLRELPFILCTAHSDSEHVRKAAQLGCRYYVVKPVQVQVLLQRVREALQSRKPAAVASGPRLAG